VMWAVRLYSAQVPLSAEPMLASAPVVAAGRLFQVMPVSVQVLSVPYTAGPSVDPLVTNSRIVAFWTVPVTPVTLKRI
jgi:hypothetical protein